ncbi:hypothetical protein MMC21_003908 [Puttea exsequens]|nr:hypothetical protein [Puttea exsequens]
MSHSPQEEEAKISPPPGRRREGNDSLWKRARRTLGTNQLTFLQPQSRPAGASTSATGPAAPGKRREQVRHAQRTHRQRTQNYIKTLEVEVVRLRESETSLLQERDKLRGYVDVLKNTIILSNIPLPPDLEETTSTAAAPRSFDEFDMPASVSYEPDDFNHDRLHVHFTPQESTQGFGYSAPPYPPAAPYSNHARPQSNSADLSNDYSCNQRGASAAPAATYDPKRSARADTIEIAIDFVLALEHPCMPHIPTPDAPPSVDPANHLMLASTPLVAQARATPQLHQTWSTSGAIIKELLNLSSSINLEGEITPIEAWHRLYQHQDFWRLDKDHIHKLKCELSFRVKCCGFGAVLDENIFWDAVNRTLASTARRR